MTRLSAFLLLTGFALAAPAAASDLASSDWRQAIRPPDRARLSKLWTAWTAARTAATDAGGAAAWNALGPLAEPSGATGGDWPGAGAYRCRIVRLGVTTPGMAPIVATAPAIPCRIDIDGDRTGFSAAGGFQRSAGRLYADGNRMIYLGAMSLRGDMSPFAYGMDPDRNQVGVLERIGPARWRLVLPWPRWQSTLDVVEIVPAN